MEWTSTMDDTQFDQNNEVSEAAVTETAAPEPPSAKTGCTNCGAALVGPRCSHCGEEQPSGHDLSLHGFIHEALDEVLHFDAKVPTTLRYLITRPGFLSTEYFAGRKSRYIRPLRLYLVIFTINFFLYTFY